MTYNIICNEGIIMPRKKDPKAQIKLKLSAKGEGLNLNSARKLLALRGLARVATLEEFTDKIKSSLGWAALAFSLVSLVLSTYKLGKSITTSGSSKLSKGFQIAMNTLGIGVGIFAATVASGLAVVATPFLALVGSLKVSIENIIGLGFDSHDKRKKKKEIKKLKNKINLLLEDKDLLKDSIKLGELNSELKELVSLINAVKTKNNQMADKSHGLMQSLIALAGSAMLFFPPTMLAGLGTLIGISSYGVLEAGMETGIAFANLANKGKNLTTNPIKLIAKLNDSLSEVFKQLDDVGLKEKILDNLLNSRTDILPGGETEQIIEHNINGLKALFEEERQKEQQKLQENIAVDLTPMAPDSFEMETKKNNTTAILKRLSQENNFSFLTTENSTFANKGTTNDRLFDKEEVKPSADLLPSKDVNKKIIDNETPGQPAARSRFSK